MLHADAAAISSDSDLVRGHLSPEAWTITLLTSRQDVYSCLVTADIYYCFVSQQTPVSKVIHSEFKYMP